MQMHKELADWPNEAQFFW